MYNFLEPPLWICFSSYGAFFFIADNPFSKWGCSLKLMRITLGGNKLLVIMLDKIDAITQTKVGKETEAPFHTATISIYNTNNIVVANVK